jgi:hypothetical protein
MEYGGFLELCGDVVGPDGVPHRDWAQGRRGQHDHGSETLMCQG